MRAGDRALAQQACSLLLGYPDEELLGRLPALTTAARGLPAAVAEPLQAFLHHLATVPLVAQQRDYVATFDLRRRCCPYLTYWTHGDTRNRGRAIVAFKQVYRDAGVMPPGEEELPDHLAVVLEFAATVDPDRGNALLVEHRAPIELLRAALAEASSPYALVLQAVAATLPTITADLVAAALRLASAGPPQELVGLDPYPAPGSMDPMGARR